MRLFSNKEIIIILLTFTLITTKVSATSIHIDRKILTTTESVIIMGNTELENFIEENNFTGSGTFDDHYIIENLNITADGEYALILHDITLYTTIRSSIFQKGSQGGVLINGSSNIILETSKLSNNSGDGIYIRYCENVIIRDNLVTNTKSLPRTTDSEGFIDFAFSIDVTRSSNILIEDNTLQDNYDGIWFWNGVTDSTIRGNTIENHILEGIGTGRELNGDLSQNNVIEDNIITSVRYGIWVWNEDGSSIIRDNTLVKSVNSVRIEGGQNLVIQDNTFTNASQSALYLGSTPVMPTINLSIISNLISNNGGYAIHGTANDILVKYNVFKNNNPDEIEFELMGNNYTFEYNYYDRWTSPDGNKDGIVDVPYKINNDIIDSYPLSDPIRQPTSLVSTSDENVFVSLILIFSGSILASYIKRK